eukprot:892848-Lingulodinium_polyedra.AAC.1
MKENGRAALTPQQLYSCNAQNLQPRISSKGQHCHLIKARQWRLLMAGGHAGPQRAPRGRSPTLGHATGQQSSASAT